MSDATQAGKGIGRAGWRALPEDDRDASEEIRFAAVLNGGVSLAVWMGGVVNEVDAVTRREGVYGRVLAALDARARVDIIAGTSAGGINGAALACTQVRGQDGAPFDDLLDTWSREGALRRLVTPPGTPEPRSVLRGDAVFLPRLQEAFHRLLPDLPVGQMYGPADRPLRLRLTTTLLNPVLTTSQDSLGTDFVQEQHRGRFTFTRPWAAGDARDDHFAPVSPENEVLSPRRKNLPDALGLASRCTASFPVAFEPVYVPIHEELGIDPPRPDMAPYANFPVSRWVIDGGVLMNTPLPLVLDDIAAAPAHLQTRRILLMVVPDPIDPIAVENTPDSRDKPVNVRETLTGVALSSLAKSIADDFDDLQRHNQAALTRRKARTDLLQSLVDAANAGPLEREVEAANVGSLESLAAGLFPSYRRIRMRRAATDLARAQARAASPDPDQAPQPDDSQVTDIHRKLWRYLNAPSPGGVPFLPRSVAEGLGSGDWRWGRSPLERLAATVQDLQRRAIWVLPKNGGPTSELRSDRTKLHEWRAALRQAVRQDSHTWAHSLTDTPVPFSPVGALLENWEVVVPTRPGTAIVEGGAAMPSGGRDTALALCELGERAARASAERGTPEMASMGGSDTWRLDALVRTFADLAGLSDDNKLRRLMALDVCLVCLSDGADVSGEDVVEVVQISTSVGHTFTNKPAEERVAGLGLNHFAAFLKQSWRVNDWIWGQLDGADRLITAMLDPARLRRQVILGRPPEELLRNLLGFPAGADLGTFERLAAALEVAVPTNEQIQALREELVLQQAEAIVTAHEADLAEAITIDIDEGADPDSTGKTWLAGYRARHDQGA